MRDHINKHIRRHTGGVVQTGPFMGMHIVDRCRWADGDASPKLLGTYEEELHPAIREMAQQAYGAIVVIGCAEGFYAVGFALLFAAIPVFGFDTSDEAMDILRENASLNGVSDRVAPSGHCTPDALAALAGTYGRLLVLCDCEGFKVELLRPAHVLGALRRSDLIVECHDFLVAHATANVFGNLRASHVPEVVYAGGRNPNQFPFLADFADVERWLAVCEGRPCLMNWIVARGRCLLPI